MTTTGACSPHLLPSTGALWILRDGEVYVDDSIAAEDAGIQETGEGGAAQQTDAGGDGGMPNSERCLPMPSCPRLGCQAPSINLRPFSRLAPVSDMPPMAASLFYRWAPPEPLAARPRPCFALSLSLSLFLCCSPLPWQRHAVPQSKPRR